MGCCSSCYIAQRITNAIRFILKERSIETVNYLDDLGRAEIPELAEESFRKMVLLLFDLKYRNHYQRHVAHVLECYF